MIPEALEELFRAAVKCQDCFGDGRLRRSVIDLPQPRLIGSGYWSSPSKTLVLLINAGSGDGRSDGADAHHRDLISQYQSGFISIESIFAHQREDLENWKRFVPFYAHGLGLQIDDLAIANIAWCGTANNQYPARMLKHCFARHTKPLMKLLRPDIVLLGGNKSPRVRE